MTRHTRRARYTAGGLTSEGGASGQAVPDYVKEQGVDPGRGTETFVQVKLQVDNQRWAGTNFVLRAGKALRRRRKGVIVRFRPVSHPSFTDKSPDLPANELRIGIDGPHTIALHLTGSDPGPPPQLAPLVLAAEPPATNLPAYSHVLLDVLRGGSSLSVRGDEAELAWRIVTPVLATWAQNRVPLETYPAGSDGPAPAPP